jgi:hypothetical protein
MRRPCGAGAVQQGFGTHTMELPTIASGGGAAPAGRPNAVLTAMLAPKSGP